MISSFEAVPGFIELLIESLPRKFDAVNHEAGQLWRMLPSNRHH